MRGNTTTSQRDERTRGRLGVAQSRDEVRQCRRGRYGSPTNKQICNKVGDKVSESVGNLVELTKGADDVSSGVDAADGGDADRGGFQPNACPIRFNKACWKVCAFKANFIRKPEP